MSAQHTPGRLVVSSQDDYPTGSAQFDGVTAGPDLFVLYHDNAKADARRLVACWNACEGIRTEALEHRAHLLKAEDDQVATLTAQRDELLAALKLAMPALQAMRKRWPRSPHDDSVDVVDVAHAAIAKVEGGAA